MTITFFAPGIPKGQPRPRAFARKFGNKWQARVHDAGTAENWKSQIAIAAGAVKPREPLTGPLRVGLSFSMPRPKSHYRSNGEVKPTAPAWCNTKPDCDNASKCVLDALTALGFWNDDAQVAVLMAAKQYGATPGCTVTITTLDHGRGME